MMPPALAPELLPLIVLLNTIIEVFLREVSTREQMERSKIINAIDTADGYGGTLSEDYIGRAIEAMGNRHDWVVMTKFGNYPMGKAPNNSGTSRGHLRKSIKRVMLGELQRGELVNALSDSWSLSRLI